MMISIIVPCYNEINFIEKIVNEINLQNFPNKQLIVVDDGSSDGTENILFEINKLV